eukprot:Ihof_evm1s60 gene=Ihof_evmTU1s60
MRLPPESNSTQTTEKSITSHWKIINKRGLTEDMAAVYDHNINTRKLTQAKEFNLPQEISGAVVISPWFRHYMDDGRCVCLEQADGDVGNHVWEGAIVLSRYLERTLQTGMKGLRVLEIGAGMGLVGLMAGLLEAREVFLTDAFDHVLHRLMRNVERTEECTFDTVHVEKLDWTTPEKFCAEHGQFDLVLGADVIYKDELTAPLLQTLRMMIKPGGRAVIANGDRVPMRHVLK